MLHFICVSIIFATRRHLASCCSVITVCLTLTACARPFTTPEQWLIPEGFRGWAKLDYYIPNAPPLPVVNGYKVVHLPRSGYLQTSSGRVDAMFSRDHYLYRTDGRWVELKFDPKGITTGLQLGVRYELKEKMFDKSTYQCVFVGTGKEYESVKESCEEHFSASRPHA
jgi:hypothetical protein